MLFQRFGVFPDDVIKSEIEFIEGQGLLQLGCGLARRIIVGVLIVDLEAGEHRVFEADVDADGVVNESRRFVSFERRGNR